MRLQDKVAIITGAGRGIGQATAVKFATEGAKVVVCDLTSEWIEETVEMCKETRGDAFGYVADVRDVQALRNMVDATVAKWGRVDCLVNNAGIVMDAQIKNMTEEQFDKVIEINLKGVYNCTKAVVDTMLKQQSGVILNASSIVGLHGNFGQTNYAASKFGLRGLHETLVQEYRGSGVRLTLVSPGPTDTSVWDPFDPDRREGFIARSAMLKPEDVAEAILFVATRPAHVLIDWLRLGPTGKASHG